MFNGMSNEHDVGYWDRKYKLWLVLNHGLDWPVNSCTKICKHNEGKSTNVMKWPCISKLGLLCFNPNKRMVFVASMEDLATDKWKGCFCIEWIRYA